MSYYRLRSWSWEAILLGGLLVASIGLVVYAVVSTEHAKTECLEAGRRWVCVPGAPIIVCQHPSKYTTICTPMPTSDCSCQ